MSKDIDANFTPEQETTKEYKYKLRPFNLFCAQNFPLIEENFDALTTYQLLCKLNGYLNKIINNQNTVQDNVNIQNNNISALYNAYNQLQDYVNHYFDNLDVQEEINNKLDEMATTGVLQHIIDEYFSLVTERINNLEREVNDTLEEQNQTIDTQNGNISTLIERMNTFTNLGEGSTTGDAELIDGRISFNGRSFTNIGQNIRTNQEIIFGKDITSNNDKVSKISENHYINTNCNLVTLNNFDVYKLKTKKGNKYFVQTVSADVAPQVIFEKKIYIPLSSSGNHVEPIYFEGTGAEVFINYQTNTNLNISLKIYEKEEINLFDYYNNITENLDVQENKYISNTGSINTVNSFNLYSFTPKKGKKYLIKSNSQAIAPLLRQSNKNFPDIEYSSDTWINNNLYEYFSLSEDTIYINFVKRTDLELTCEVYESKETFLPTEEIVIKNTLNGATNKAVFIGDSLTYGQTYTGQNQSYRNFYNYPYFMQKLNNFNEILEIARSGATATTWWEQFNEQITEQNAIYFVWLGTNDVFTDTVATDCSGNDYTQFANTNTGNMGKILGKIKSLSNNKIVILNNFATQGTLSTNNKVISELAQKFGCILVDINSSDVKNTKYHTAYNNYYNAVHFNNAGHSFVANFVTQRVNEYLQNNQNALEIYKDYI